jgi:nicotinate-nucleotide adenylyltransferase
MLQTQVSDKYSSDSQVQGFVHPSLYTVYYRDVTLLDISSSSIRDLLAKGCSVRYLLPEKVENYIHQRGLYRNSEESIKS